MRWLTASLCAAAVYLLLRFAPLPRYLRLLLLFTAPLLYNGPVVARSYSLMPRLIFLLAKLRRQTHQRPLISAFNLLAIAFCATLLIWLYRLQRLLMAIPFCLLALLPMKVPVQAHHALVWWFALVGLWWMAWPSPDQAQTHIRIHRLMQALLLLVVAEQAVYGGAVIR